MMGVGKNGAATAMGVKAFFFPAYQSVVPQITPKEMLTSANSLNGLSGRLTGIRGSIVGAGLVVAGSTSFAFALDALSFLVSTLCILPIIRSSSYASLRQAELKTATKPKFVREAIQQGFADLHEGWRAIITIPWIWITILIFGVLNIMEASPRAVAIPH
jgi:hypothetical protein